MQPPVRSKPAGRHNLQHLDDADASIVTPQQQSRGQETTDVDDEPTEALRTRLAAFYAKRTITRQPILPQDCANAICWLAGEASAKTTGHVIPVDGGLPEAFSR